METSIFRYILRYSRRNQIILVLLAVLSWPAQYASYELPKQIVNDAIQPKRPYPKEATLFKIGLGFNVDQVTWLFALCGVFLFIIYLNQFFKYINNSFKGITGERMLRRFRYELYGRVLRFPQSTFRNMSQGEIIPMIAVETEALGGFIGDAFAVPVFNGGQLLVTLSFLFLNNWLMGIAAVAFYPVQLLVTPRQQRKVNRLGKERVRLVRAMSDRIGEVVQGVEEIHVHDTSRFERADFSRRLGAIYRIRLMIYQRKFAVKAFNNLVQQFGPLSFYAIGGYFVIKGQMEVGTLLAAVSAQKDLAGPWKEILNNYQIQEDARIKYEQIISQFDPAGLRDQRLLDTEPEQVLPLKGDVVATNLSLKDDQDVALVDGVNLRFGLTERVAVVGAAGSGREHLAQLLAHLVDPTAGSLAVGGNDLAKTPEAITGRRMGYVGAGGFVFNAAIGDNLYYGLKHRQLAPNADPEVVATYERFKSDAILAGNSTDDYFGLWIDYQAAGVDAPPALTQKSLRVLETVGLTDDVYNFGLRGTIDPKREAQVAESVLRARAAFKQRLDSDPSTAALVERFDPVKYNENATVGENLLFGNPIGDAFNMDRLGENAYVLSVLDRAGLTDKMVQTGYQVASTMVELFADLPPDHEFFQQFSFIKSDDLPEYQAILSRVDKDHIDQLKPEERGRLMSLPFLLIPARHRLGIVDEEFKATILKARAVFAESLPEELRKSVEFYDSSRYIAAANLQDNILFGKIAYGEAQSGQRVGALLAAAAAAAGLHDTVVQVGLNFQVGVAGSRLTPAQRQRLLLARSLIKQPDVLIVNEGLSALDPAGQMRIMGKLLEEFKDRCLVWTMPSPDAAKAFDRVVVMRGGRVLRAGTFSELNGSGTGITQLLEEKIA
ncbi:MAG: ATP-binding cassette domain-containing protein [Alphaproteobacteria bacterium]|nr:ATP-binding cassette domain-containing protein [Alphaproteobacteria bacterium]